MAISSKKALEAAKVIVDYCNEQKGCQNCIFRLNGTDHWKCNIEAFDLQDVLSNIEAKKKNRGWIQGGITMDVREKLVELLTGYSIDTKPDVEYVVDHLISRGVTVQEHGYWETVVEVRSNTVCGNGVKIEYKRCSCCKNPPMFWGDDFCGHCGAKLDLPQPLKGE